MYPTDYVASEIPLVSEQTIDRKRIATLASMSARPERNEAAAALANERRGNPSPCRCWSLVNTLGHGHVRHRFSHPPLSASPPVGSAEVDTVALVADLLRSDVHNYLTASYHLQEIAERDAREARAVRAGAGKGAALLDRRGTVSVPRLPLRCIRIPFSRRRRGERRRRRSSRRRTSNITTRPTSSGRRRRTGRGTQRRRRRGLAGTLRRREAGQRTGMRTTTRTITTIITPPGSITTTFRGTRRRRLTAKRQDSTRGRVEGDGNERRRRPGSARTAVGCCSRHPRRPGAVVGGE